MVVAQNLVVAQVLSSFINHLARVAETGPHDNGFVIELFVVIENFRDADDSGIFFRLVAFLVRVSHVPIQNSAVGVSSEGAGEERGVKQEWGGGKQKWGGGKQKWGGDRGEREEMEEGRQVIGEEGNGG